MLYFYAYSAFHYCTIISDFLKFNGEHSMQDELMVGVFAIDSLEIWNAMLIFRIKTGGGVM